MLQFSVKDTGIGLDKEQASKLFNAFTQADNSTSRKYGGTGLGLAISKALVELLGGSIGLRSKKGSGSNFHFTATFEKIPDAQSEEEAIDKLFEDQKILIVSGNHTLKAIIKRYVADSFGKIEEAENGKDGLSRLKSAKADSKIHDICIIDLRLPDMDGWQLASKINADKSINMTKLMLLTTQDMGSGEAKMKALGWFNTYIGKPVKKRELIAALIKITNTDFDLSPVDETASARLGAVKSEAADDFSGNEVLVVEDNEINSQLFKLVLENLGIGVLLAPDGLEAVKSVGTQSFDLIFMDIQMPNMNGYDATAAIRQQGIETPIIAVTANALKSEIEKAFSSGMNDYITKPFKRQELILILRKWMLQCNEKNNSLDDSEKTEQVLKVFDVEKALEVFLGKKEMLFDLVSQFRDKVEGQLASIGDAFQAGDFERLRMEAHSIKGASLNLCAQKIADVSCRLEYAASVQEGLKAEEYIRELARSITEFGEIAVEAKKKSGLNN